MEDLGKVNSMQLYNLWKNLTVGLITVIAMMTFSKLLPFFCRRLFLCCARPFFMFIFLIRGWFIIRHVL